MLRYALTPSNSSNGTSNGTRQERSQQPVPRVISLSDDAHGADQYLAWRKRGYELRRLETQDGE